MGSLKNLFQQKINVKIIDFHLEAFSHVADFYVKQTGREFVRVIQQNQKKRHSFEEILKLVKTSTIQNLFVVAKDEEGAYFFLLDAEADSLKKAHLNEPFNPLADFWDIAYTTHQAQIYYHKKSPTLWISVAYPIVQDGKTLAVIGADISHTLDANTQMNLQNFSKFFFWIVLLSIVWVLLLYSLTLYFRRKFYEGYIDPLTHIYNRKYLNEIVLKKLPRNYQVFMLDIDLFKVVNDTYGHVVGDFILESVAQSIERLIRFEDILIRYGGEEFLIITKNLSQEKAVAFAQRIRKDIQESAYAKDGMLYSVTISIGICIQGDAKQSFSEVLRYADEALYRAKKMGRNRVELYSDH
jgi:diguanylate cyclase (GGDEF)-like protein